MAKKQGKKGVFAKIQAELAYTLKKRYPKLFREIEKERASKNKKRTIVNIVLNPEDSEEMEKKNEKQITND